MLKTEKNQKLKNSELDAYQSQVAKQRGLQFADYADRKAKFDREDGTNSMAKAIKTINEKYGLNIPTHGQSFGRLADYYDSSKNLTLAPDMVGEHPRKQILIDLLEAMYGYELGDAEIFTTPTPTGSNEYVFAYKKLETTK